MLQVEMATGFTRQVSISQSVVSEAECLKLDAFIKIAHARAVG